MLGKVLRDPVSGGQESCCIISIRAQAKGARGGEKASRRAGRVSREVVWIDGPSDQGDTIKVSIMSSCDVVALLAHNWLERTRHTAPRRSAGWRSAIPRGTTRSWPKMY
jgi:hypothetical protein